MSTISSPQEAYEALCNGEFFQVGGQIINPTDIVRVDRNGGTNPVFHLEDGSVVQHDRFKEGDVGDYLAAALTVATRGQAQSQAIKPAANRLFRVNNGSARLLDIDGNAIRTYPPSDVGNVSAADLDLENDAVAIHDDFSSQIFLFDLEGNQLASYTYSFNPGPQGGFWTMQPDGSAVFVGIPVADTDLRVFHLERDGTVTTLTNVTTSNSISVPIGGTLSAGTDGYAILQDGNVFRRYPLDNATGSGSTFSNALPENALVYQSHLEEETDLLYYVNDNRDLVSLDVSNLSANETVIYGNPDSFFSTNKAAVSDYIPVSNGKDRFGLVNDFGENPTEFRLIDEDGKELERSSLNGVIAAQLDLSAI
jgi:hypothetical protein